MAKPNRFSWIESPFLAAMARPSAADELVWVRDQGIQVIITLTENPLPRAWVNDAGLMAVHVPVPDLMAPSRAQFETCVGVLRKARGNSFGAVVHCAAGIGRTGTIIAGWFVAEGLDPDEAIAKIRSLRPGSVETPAQEAAIREFAESIRTADQ
jgi:atypical dual specificity phosphatase